MAGFAQTTSGAAERIPLVRLAQTIFDDVAAMSADVEGVSRPAFSPVESRVLDYLAGVAEARSLRSWRDPGGNLLVAADDGPPDAPCGVIGSHVDSVPQGGNFDGLAGVVAGLLTLMALRDAGALSDLPIRVLALRGEESAWFGRPYMGSKVLTGGLGPSDLKAVRRDAQSTLADAMAAVGIDIEKVAAGDPLIDVSRLAFFLELHIEQGPVLTDRNWPVAAVTGIRGNIRYPRIECIGEAGHSGTVPRWLRHDAVVATAELITRMDEHWATIQEHGGDLVMTTGVMQTDSRHHAMTRIAGEAMFSFEARSLDVETLHAIDALLHSERRIVERDRGVSFEFGERLRSEPEVLDRAIVEAIRKAAADEGLPSEAIPSGAGHDAAVFAAAGVRSGLIFVRNAHGSHNPREAMEISDLMAAVAVLGRVVRELAA